MALPLQIYETSKIPLKNVYIPLTTCCTPGYHPPAEQLLNKLDSLILGDFNAHHPLWHSKANQDVRGEDIAELVDNSDFGVLTRDSP